MKLTNVLVAMVATAALGGCAAADPTGGLLGEPTDELMVDQQANQPKCPGGETLFCETRSPNRVSDGRYGFRGNRMQKRCNCFPDRYVDSMIDAAGSGIGDPGSN